MLKLRTFFFAEGEAELWYPVKIFTHIVDKSKPWDQYPVLLMIHKDAF